jgi:hypothetical protein
MPYIKISDPNIIDLAAWHQVINVINQHSDSLTAITNNFGAQGSGTTSWNGANDIKHQYDSGSQKIIYGRTKVSNDLTNASTGNHMLYLTINLEDSVSGTAPFAAKPIITTTASFGSDDPTPDSSGGRENVICTISAITEESFILRIVNARSTKTNPVPLFTSDTQYFYINWIAIGPK